MIRRVVPWVAWLAVALLGARFVWFTLATAREPSDGFAAYYTAARLLREGEPVSRFYDNAWFRLQVARFNPAEDDIYNVNPPPTALLALPLAGLDRDLARLTWLILSLLVLAARTTRLSNSHVRRAASRSIPASGSASSAVVGGLTL